MKNQIKKSFILSLILLAQVFSCRNEDDLNIDPPSETALMANSTVANLMSRVAMNDGSYDNMIDFASNLSVQLPVTVTANGTKLEITNSDGYEAILDIFDSSDSDVDTLVISYPITVMLSNYSALVVNSSAELQALSNNGDDDDIECIDFEYPITVSFYSETTDSIGSIIVNDDEEMHDLIDDLKKLTAVTINFPINVMYSDGSTLTINNIPDLANAITAADGTCDEDDNNDFNDCNSKSYATKDLESIFADCTSWSIDKLKRSNTSLVKNYVDHVFTFNNDGTITITENANTYTGTWSATDTGSQIDVAVNVVGLPDFDNTWILCKINRNAKEKQVELKLGTDRLRFGSYCEN